MGAKNRQERSMFICACVCRGSLGETGTVVPEHGARSMVEMQETGLKDLCTLGAGLQECVTHMTSAIRREEAVICSLESSLWLQG